MVISQLLAICTITVTISLMKKNFIFSISRTIIGLWKTKSSAIEQRAKMEEDHEEDVSSVDLDDVHAVLSIGDVPLPKEYSLEHPVDVRSLCLLLPSFPDSVQGWICYLTSCIGQPVLH